MGDDAKWKRRTPSRIYDYNYKVSEGYYKPQTDFMSSRSLNRNREVPPEHQSYAERYASNPWYGGTRGLPYNDSKAAMNEPMLKLADRHMRSSSLLRDMKKEEEEDIPLNLRASRRKKKFEEEEEKLGIRPRFSRTISWDSGTNLKTDLSSKINQRIRNLDDELHRSTRTALLADTPSKWSYDLDRPTSRIRHKEESYSLPSGGSVRRSSHTESRYQSSSSSKPPIIPSRKISFSDEVAQFKPRMRLHSGGDYAALPRSSRRTSVDYDDEETSSSLYTSKAGKLREERRMRESRELAENVTNLVEKMRIKDIDPEGAYNITRSSRSSSVDRRHRGGDQPRSRRGSQGNFVYGVGRY